MIDRAEYTKREAKITEQFQKLERESRQIENNIRTENQAKRQLEKAEELFSEVYQKKIQQLDELSGQWKGAHALSVLSESASNHQNFQRQQAKQLFERRTSIEASLNSLYHKQEKIVREKRIIVRGE